jgi:hypothetical protein
MSQEREPHSGFEKSATFYLEAAQIALVSGQPRLAIYLYCAAFEVESTCDTVVSSRVIEGLRKAWDIACEHGDRSIAESILSDLAPFNSAEQNEQATMRLQGLALGQLEDMGVTEDDLAHIAGALSHEMLATESAKLLDSLQSALEQLALPIEGEERSKAIQKLPSANVAAASPQNGLARISRELRDLNKRRSGRDGQQQALDFAALVGYDQALEHMRRFGFYASDDDKRRRFVEQSAAMHGVSRLSLDGTFLFFGATHEDVALFAHATAGEVGVPVLHITVDLDGQGNGTIKLAGPFRHGLFGGPPDPTDMVTPCTVLIENVDLLQKMFVNEQQAIQRFSGKPSTMMGNRGRSMQAEITGYLRVLRQKPGVVMMATAQRADTLAEPLRSLLGPIHEIEIANPCESERRALLYRFAGEHPSFAELDVNRLAYLSEGLSRKELTSAVHAAAEAAHRESLRTGTYSRVDIGDVLVQFAPLIDHESPLYQQVEDEAVAQLYREIEKDML